MRQSSSGSNPWTTAGVAVIVATTATIAVAAFRIKKKSSSRSSSSSDGRMITTTTTNENNNDNYWHDRIHPELMMTPPELSLDSLWKLYAIRLLGYFVPSGRPSSGVRMMKVKGIGTYFYPEHRRRHRQRDDGMMIDDDDIDIDDKPRCAIMWIHGGGRVLGWSYHPGDVAMCCKIVRLFGVPVLSADYRKPPEHPFPAGLHDLREAYRWLSNKVRKGGEGEGEGGRIGISGMSAGGGLAAELCQKLLDESRGRRDDMGGGGGGGGEGEEMPPAPLPLPACQLLLDPMLDDRTSRATREEGASASSSSSSSSSDNDMPPHILWNNKSNAFAWSLYLGGGRRTKYEPGGGISSTDDDDNDNDDNLPPPEYSSASRREDLSGLPPAFVHVGDLDLFHDECTAYARRLDDHGVPTELVVTEGGYHGYMLFHIDGGPANVIWERLRAFGGRYLFDDRIGS